MMEVDSLPNMSMVLYRYGHILNLIPGQNSITIEIIKLEGPDKLFLQTSSPKQGECLGKLLERKGYGYRILQRYTATHHLKRYNPCVLLVHGGEDVVGVGTAAGWDDG